MSCLCKCTYASSSLRLQKKRRCWTRNGQRRFRRRLMAAGRRARLAVCWRISSCRESFSVSLPHFFHHESFETLWDIHDHLHFLKLINGQQLFFNSTHQSAPVHPIHSPKQINITVCVLLTNWFSNVTGCSHFYDHLRHVPLEQETRPRNSRYQHFMLSCAHLTSVYFSCCTKPVAKSLFN